MPPLTILTIAWLLGILLAGWLSPGWPVVALAGLPILGGLILYRRDASLRLAAASALFLLLGMARWIIAQPVVTPGHIAWYNDTGYALLTAVVADEPDERDTYTNLRVQVKTITPKNSQSIPVTGLALLRTERYPAYHYGDTLEIFAKPETPPVFESFSYKDYLARSDIHTYIRRPRIKLLEPQAGFSVRAGIYAFKMQAHQVINRLLPEPQAALLNGILLGLQSGIPKALYDQFNATGSSHVIVISGSNISMVVGILLLAGQKLLGKQKAALVALLGVAFYTVMVGANAAVVRAALMGGLYVLAMALGRPNMALNSLFVSALVMTAINPFALWDAGFQLSFTATLGLIVLVPLLERATAGLLSRIPTAGGLHTLTDLLREALLVTVAAQIITLPLIIYQFGRVSLISLLTNLLIVPVQPLVMIFGGLATLAGLVFLPLGQLIGWVAWLPLTWTIAVVEWTSGFKWAQIATPPMPFWGMALCYLLLAAVIRQLKRLPEQRRVRGAGAKPAQCVTLWMWAGAAIILLLLGAVRLALPDGRLHVVFLDVGQGDAILITTPHGRQILVDGGPSPAQLGRQLGRRLPFWDKTLDLVVSTHPDSDHLTGLLEVIDRYQVDVILTSNVAENSPLSKEWERRLEANGRLAVMAEAGMVLPLDDQVQAVALNPGPACISSADPNAHSVVLKLTFGQISFLLPGDIEADVEDRLVAGGSDLPATVLKSAHHGSKTSSSADFLAAVDPQLVLISVGVDNSFGHPSPEVLQRYADLGVPVFRTDERGAIEVTTDGKQLWLETER